MTLGTLTMHSFAVVNSEVVDFKRVEAFLRSEA
jgi:hypothetical protein